MHVSKDSMWRRILKNLTKWSGTKQGLGSIGCPYPSDQVYKKIRKIYTNAGKAGGEPCEEELYVFYVLPLQTRRALLFADPMGTVHVCEIFAQWDEPMQPLVMMLLLIYE